MKEFTFAVRSILAHGYFPYIAPTYSGRHPTDRAFRLDHSVHGTGKRSAVARNPAGRPRRTGRVPHAPVTSPDAIPTDLNLRGSASTLVFMASLRAPGHFAVTAPPVSFVSVPRESFTGQAAWFFLRVPLARGIGINLLFALGADKSLYAIPAIDIGVCPSVSDRHSAVGRIE